MTKGKKSRIFPLIIIPVRAPTQRSIVLFMWLSELNWAIWFFYRCVHDSSYQELPSPSSYVVRWTFNSFHFLEKHSKIYLKCQLVICQAYDYSSRCYQGCLPRKNKKVSPLQNVNVIVGPVQLQKEDINHGKLFLWFLLFLQQKFQNIFRSSLKLPSWLLTFCYKIICCCIQCGFFSHFIQ